MFDAAKLAVESFDHLFGRFLAGASEVRDDGEPTDVPSGELVLPDVRTLARTEETVRTTPTLRSFLNGRIQRAVGGNLVVGVVGKHVPQTELVYPFAENEFVVDLGIVPLMRRNRRIDEIHYAIQKLHFGGQQCPAGLQLREQPGRIMDDMRAHVVHMTRGCFDAILRRAAIPDLSGDALRRDIRRRDELAERAAVRNVRLTIVGHQLTGILCH